MPVIRDPTAADEKAWRNLWSQYNKYYRVVIPETVTDHTWQRILDPTSPIFGRLAIINGSVAGFSVSVLHEGTWTTKPVCSLEDLFVEPPYRSRGCGRQLVQDLMDRAKSKGWSRLYWHTDPDNPARRLYDRFVLADDFVRYRLVLSPE